jgi:hypothetical protein
LSWSGYREHRRHVAACAIAGRRSIADGGLLGFEARADQLIELAFHGGIAIALAYADRPLSFLSNVGLRVVVTHAAERVGRPAA